MVRKVERCRVLLAESGHDPLTCTGILPAETSQLPRGENIVFSTIPNSVLQTRTGSTVCDAQLARHPPKK